MFRILSNALNRGKYETLQVGDRLRSKSLECEAEILAECSIAGLKHYKVSIEKNGVKIEKTLAPDGLMMGDYKIISAKD